MSQNYEKCCFLSTYTFVHNLVANVDQILALKSSIQLNNLKFEHLCHNMASTLQEVSLRLVKMTESDRDLRDKVLECRKVLLECANTILIHSDHPFEAFPHIESLPSVCVQAMQLAEFHAIKTTLDKSLPVLDALDSLEKCSSYETLFLNIKLFTSKLNHFLDETAVNCNDLNRQKCKTDVIVRVDCIKKLLPAIIQSLRESMKQPVNCHTRTNREFFFKMMRTAIEDIVRVFQGLQDPQDSTAKDDAKDEQVGQFIECLDRVLDTCEVPEQLLSPYRVLDQLDSDVEWLVKFSLSVAKVSDLNEEEEIVSTCHHVLSLLMTLRKALNEERSEAEPLLRSLKDAVECLEQTMNNILLKLIIHFFCSIDSPLDMLIHHILNSSVSPPDRLPEDLDDLVNSVDNRADLLFHVAHFTTFCTTDKVRAQSISTNLYVMQKIETELVPACLKLYFNPEDQGARFHLKTIRNLWLQQSEELENNILGIVDATAFCFVSDQEARIVAATIKKEQYSQDQVQIHQNGCRLVRMCERAVDFAWKDASKKDVILPDNHPIVKVERSTLEVQRALTLLLNNVEDLNLHKTMLRRVQVLVTCLGTLVHYLMNKNETTSLSMSKVRVLTSVSRIDIGKNAQMTVVSDIKPNVSVSRSKAMSFRSVQKTKLAFIKKRQDDSNFTNERLVDDTISKLSKSQTLPFRSRKMQCKSGDKEVELSPRQRSGSYLVTKNQTGFDFTEIYAELSALSKEITKSLTVAGNDQGLVQGAAKAVVGVHEQSLRQIAMKNAGKINNETDKAFTSAADMINNIGITTPKRLQDIRTLETKLALIKSELEGTELK